MTFFRNAVLVRKNSCIQIKEMRVIKCVSLSVRDRRKALQDMRVGHQQFPTEGPSAA